MKIEKSNNPAAAGALVLVLILIVGRIAWMLFGHSRVASAASTAAASSSSPASAPIITPASADARPQVPMASLASSLEASGTGRNPFVYSVPDRPAPIRIRSDAASRDHDAKDARLAPLLPLPVWGGKPGAAGEMGQDVQPIPADQSASGLASGTISPDSNPLQTLKLTAIVEGTMPMAVLQTARPEPVILRVGDNLDGMRVIAIHENKMVFARGKSRWTLPLQSAAGGSAIGSIAVNSATVPEEEKTDELQ